MATINIGASNADDAFYRYKMPKLQARIEGRGNGIKTNVVNNVDIAKALERPPDYIIKYFGCELGAQTKYDAKSGTSIVNGAHDAGKLSEILEGFIKKYVQCYSCGNPETVFKIKKDNIFLKCKACGAVSDVDMRHRLNTYILKHPPEDKLSKAEKKLKKAEKERLKGVEGGEDKPKKKKKDKEGKGEGKAPRDKEEGKENAAGTTAEEGDEPEEAEEEEEEDDDVEWLADTSEEAMRARAAEQLSAATAAMVTQGNLEAEAEREAARRKAEEAKAEEDARLAAEAARALALEQARKPAAGGGGGESGSESEEGEEDLVEELRELAATVSPAKVAGALRRVEVEGGTVGKMRLLYEALFSEPGDAKLPALVGKHAELLQLHAEDATQQMAQLLALEALLTHALPQRRKEAPLLLKALYDADVVAEEVVLAWHGKVGAGRVVGVAPADGKVLRDAAAPFVEWLRQDSEDEDSDDEEDDDEE